MIKVNNDKVLEIINNEIENYEMGISQSISSNEELEETLGCSSSQVTRCLRNYKDLAMRRRSIIMSQSACKREQCRPNDFIIPSPSVEFAWFLGALSGDGSSTYGDNTKNHALRLNVTSKEFRDKFEAIGNNIFGLRARLSEYSPQNPIHKKVYTCSFYSRPIVDYLGDFRSDNWHKAMQERHSWVASDEIFSFGFITGYFDSEGSVNKRKARLEITVAYKEPARYLLNLLQNQGIKAFISKNKGQTEGIGGVIVCGLEDVKRFAKNIYSCIPEKEERLTFYRNAERVGVPNEIIDAYNFALKVKQEGWTSINISKYLLLKGLDINPRRIRNWTNGKCDPKRREGKIILP